MLGCDVDFGEYLGAGDDDEEGDEEEDDEEDESCFVYGTWCCNTNMDESLSTPNVV
jgi:hypothetical protein